MSNPLQVHALRLLDRGHRLYGSEFTGDRATSRAQLTDYARRLIAVGAHGGIGSAAVPNRRVAASLERAAAADTELATVVAQAKLDRERGWQATRWVLDDARADPMPATDTALGQREAVRRTTARLRSQRRSILRSRRRSRRLAARMRRLSYPNRRRTSRGIPVGAVGFDDSVVTGQAKARVAAALDRLGIDDAAARRNWMRGYQTLIARESSGRAAAIASEPAAAPGPVQPDGRGLGYARGIAQLLPATFAPYHQPGTSTNIYDPVANICASMNYVMHRYGVTADGANLVALVQQADPRRAPKGY